MAFGHHLQIADAGSRDAVLARRGDRRQWPGFEGRGQGAWAAAALPVNSSSGRLWLIS